MARRKYTLTPSILKLFGAMDVKAWVFEGRVAHSGSDELREEIGQNIELLRDKVGLRKTALFFGAVLLVAMDRGSFDERDIKKLDALGQGNALYLLEKMEEMGSE
ncbi:hypothetical protein [Streptomyces sp. NPDC097610]|uniref:hypothetical protein n=1 Tax=Streptomyces sp. NPDC097610 TaxID=3157227 RepID=UPI003327347E